MEFVVGGREWESRIGGGKDKKFQPNKNIFE
jgi:hypothetical protein